MRKVSEFKRKLTCCLTDSAEEKPIYNAVSVSPERISSFSVIKLQRQQKHTAFSPNVTAQWVRFFFKVQFSLEDTASPPEPTRLTVPAEHGQLPTG